MAEGIKKKIAAFPDSPGVYIMKSRNGKTLYVGKAISLKKRVMSYFRGKAADVKTGILLEKIDDIDFIPCDTEAQALILEASLIKERKPQYNIALRDDKSYPYVAVTNEDFPRVFPLRTKSKNGLFLFGPYPNVKLIKEALKLIRRIFPYRSCKHLPKTPCLYYHLNLCCAPCSGKISVSGYKDIVDNLCRVLSGDKKSLMRKLEKKMVQASKDERFEEAAALRDKIVAVKSLYAGKNNVHEVIFLKDVLRLKEIPLSIEAIDISNVNGIFAAGSVVVFKDGMPLKNDYRRFRIKRVYHADDYGMIEEVVKRRYLRLKRGRLKLPQLVVIDGGRGQVNAAFRILKDIGLDIPVVGIAKRNEELWLVGKGKPLIIPKDNPALQLIQRVRDEAHRFAHKYHLLLRKKRMLNK